MKKWSFKYEKCKICGTKKIKHRAKGICHNCYIRTRKYALKYYYKNKEALKEKMKERYQKQKALKLENK